MQEYSSNNKGTSFWKIFFACFFGCIAASLVLGIIASLCVVRFTHSLHQNIVDWQNSSEGQKNQKEMNQSAEELGRQFRKLSDELGQR